MISTANLQRIWVDLMRNLVEAFALFLLNQPVAARRVDFNSSKQTAKPCSPVDDAPMTSTHPLEPSGVSNLYGRHSIRRRLLYVKRVCWQACFHPDGIWFLCVPRAVAPRLSFRDDVSTRGRAASRSEVGSLCR